MGVSAYRRTRSRHKGGVQGVQGVRGTWRGAAFGRARQDLAAMILSRARPETIEKQAAPGNYPVRCLSTGDPFFMDYECPQRR
jgi:hypothetical protein